MMSTAIPRDKEKQTSMGLDISFSEEDLDHVMHPHEDPLVISADIGPNSTLNKVIIDGGSSVDVLY